jgi:chloramphenicol-sensitive protein RarD
VYHEAFGAVRAVGYGAIWIALALYSFEGLRNTVSLREARRTA